MAKKRIGIIGVTGSIGRQAADVIMANPELFEVVFVTGHTNKELLFKTVAELKACYGVLTSEEGGDRTLIDIIDGEKPDIILHAASGVAAAKSVYEAALRGIDIALANKESIVTAGKIIMDTAEKNNSKIIPVDSEHSAIFQCLMGQRKKSLEKITLTASGGPFRKRPGDALDYVDAAEALRHPNWNMGRKISVDSATMMNKGLELIEARYLFDVDRMKLDVIIHPESVVHSFVTFSDGSTIAQMGKPDMRVPISFALGFPERINSRVEPVNLCEIGSLTFEKPDMKRFPCLSLAQNVLRTDSNALMTAMNAANEAAVTAFLNGRIGFSHIAKVVEAVLEKTSFPDASLMEEAWENSRLSYEAALAVIDGFAE